MPVIALTSEQLKQHIETIIAERPMQLYRDEVVCNDKRTKSKSRRYGYRTAEKKHAERRSFCAVIAEQVLLYKEKFGYLGIPDGCTYRLVKKEHLARLGELAKMTAAEAIDDYINRHRRREERLIHCLCAQGSAGGLRAIDYQVPVRNGGHDKIDLVLQDSEGNFYLTEGKKFGSDESFLRCVLEIQTYYALLTKQFLENNGWTIGKVRKAVLIDRDSFAYEQLNEPWAKALAAAFDIHIFILSHDEDWKFDIEAYHN